MTICAEHGTAPEPVHEDNWFFALSRWQKPVRDAIESGRLAIAPDAARAETLAFLAGDVRDISVSRVASRANGWGIPVPGDPSQVIFIWFDALANYLTAAGERYWQPERAHVIGKGITRFHAVYWPAFLLAAGLPLPERICVHGYLTIDGEKIAKSGRAVPVPPIVERVGADALRWYFCAAAARAPTPTSRWRRSREPRDNDLADRLGNLVQRCVTLAGDRAPPASDLKQPLRALAEALPARVDAALRRVRPRRRRRGDRRAARRREPRAFPRGRRAVAAAPHRSRCRARRAVRTARVRAHRGRGARPVRPRRRAHDRRAARRVERRGVGEAREDRGGTAAHSPLALTGDRQQAAGNRQRCSAFGARCRLPVACRLLPVPIRSNA